MNQRHRQSAESLPATKIEAIRVLLAEDSDRDAELVLHELRRAGLKVESRRVQTEGDFRRALDEFLPEIILSDFAMPGFGGVAALGICRDAGVEIPFIFVSGTIGEEVAVEAMKAGADDYVMKTNLIRLGPTVQRALREAALRRGRKLAESALRRAQVMAKLAHVVTAPDGALESWSDTFPALAGVSAADMPKHMRDWVALVHPDDRERVRARAIEAARTGNRYEFEYRLKRAGGAWAHVRQVAEPLSGAADASGGLRWFGTLQDVTDQKRAEEEQRGMRLLLDNIVENIPTAVQLKSVEDGFRVVLWNKAAEDMYGMTRAEAIGRNVHDLWPKADADRFHAADLDLIAGGRMQEFFDRPNPTRNRGTLRLHMRKVALHDAAGKATHLLVIADDTTTQLADQERLLESEARFRSLTELSSDWYWEQDEEYRFVRFTGGEKDDRGLGADQPATLGLRRWELPDVTPVSASWEEHKALLEARKPFRDFEYRRVLVGGAFLYVASSGEPVFDAAGRFKGYRGVASDITERKRAEQSLQRFQFAMDMSIDTIYLTDAESLRFVYVNEMASRRLGYPRDRLLLMGPEEVLGTGREEIKREYTEVIAAGEHGVKFESRFQRSDGSEGWTEINRRALVADGRHLIVTIGRDITERKLADERIRRLNRIYAVLSGINALIVRASDRNELFQEACRIAVGAGKFRAAWIGVVDRAANTIRPVAWQGLDDDYVRAMPIAQVVASDGSSPEKKGLAPLAILHRKPMVAHDMTADPRIMLKQKAQERGFRSLAMLPLLVSGEAVGVMALYAAEVGFFDEEEIRLLTELAGDIAFAIDHIAKAEKLDYLAYYDALTGLANRTLFQERLTQHIHAARNSERKVAVVVVDIERFRMINDSLGRQAGDAMLKQISERLARAVDQAEIARIGADHFAIVLPEMKGRSEIGRTLENIWHRCVNEPFMLGDAEIRIALKGGIALFPGDGNGADTLFRNAEAAWKDAKKKGERYLFHAREMTARIAEKLTLENKLRLAVEKEEFVLHYQPKVEVETRRIVGVEALIRWQSPERGLVPPGLFIPQLEETGLILRVGAWALRRAALDHKDWLAQGLAAPRVAVNVSQIQMRQRDFVDVVKAMIAHGADPTGIDLEITESLLMEDVAGNIEKLQAVCDMGLKIAIDDFGTGYSSLGYLAQLPVHMLKIDRSFIMKMLNDPNTMTLVQTIISLAHSLRLSVVAEGVEKEDQAKMLRLLRCDDMQGYLISKPVPVETLTALLRASK